MATPEPPAIRALQKSPARKALEKQQKAWLDSLDYPEAKYAAALDNWNKSVAETISQDLKDHPERADSWSNALTGIGTARDKITASTFAHDGLLQFGILEDLYHNDDMAARCVDAVPEQMMREGFEIDVQEDPELGEEIETALENLEASEAIEECDIYGRLYGGSLLLVGANDGVKNPAEPLKEDAIKSIDFLTPVDRFSVFPVSWYNDPLKPKFGQPEIYRFLLPTTPNPGGIMTFQVGQEVHESRMIRFRGARTSIRRRRVNFGWDDSILQRVYQALQAFGLNWASITHLLSDVSQGVLKVKDLANMITGQAKDALTERAALMDQTRSVARVLMLDADSENFERVQTPFSGIPELLDRTAQRLSAAAGMPVTVLMGTSPGGLNATGESDIRNWYDKIASRQNRVLNPRLKRLVTLLMLSKKGPTGGKVLDFNIVFPPLWQLDPKVEADRRLVVAQTDQIEIDKGITTAEEVAVSRHRSTGYSAETTIDLKLRKELLDADAQAAQLGAGKAQQAAEDKQAALDAPAPVVVPAKAA